MPKPEEPSEDIQPEDGEPLDPDAGAEDSLAAPESAEQALPSTGEELADTGPEIPWDDYDQLVSYPGTTLKEKLTAINQKMRESTHRDEDYGRVSNELGDARKMLAQLVGAKTSPEPSTSAIKEMSEAEKNVFFEQLQRNPNQLFANMREDVKKEIIAELGPTLRGHAHAVAVNQECAALDKAHPGWEEHEPRMRAIMESNPNLERQPYEDILLFVHLEDSDESYLAKDVKRFMSFGISFEESKRIALAQRSQPSSKGQRQQTPATTKPGNAAATGRRSTVKPGSTPPAAETMEDLAEQMKLELAGT